MYCFQVFTYFNVSKGIHYSMLHGRKSLPNLLDEKESHPSIFHKKDTLKTKYQKLEWFQFSFFDRNDPIPF